MNTALYIQRWLEASNAYDTATYLNYFEPGAVLDDPSVGRIFEGHSGIKRYFETYFIGYNTQTELIELTAKGAKSVHVEVKFTGDFPEGTIGGMFDIEFEDEKIKFVKADLI